MIKLLKAFYNRVIEVRQLQADRHIAMMQLKSMSDRELHDIGISRGEIRDLVFNGKTTY